MGQFFYIIYLIVVFGLIVFLAWFCTKKLASAKKAKAGGNLRLVESCSVGMQSHVQIVRAGQKYVLIGVTKGTITFLADLDPEDIAEDGRVLNSPFGANLNGVIPFDKVLKRLFPKNDFPGSDGKGGE